MSHPTIRFPPPPPTRNDLTAEQRAQLLRSNNKLQQVLGTTPHVLDLSYTPKPAPLRVDIPSRSSDDYPRSPPKNHRRTRSMPYSDENMGNRDIDRVPDCPRPSTSSSSRSSVKSHTSTTSTDNSEQAWRTPYSATHRPPLLKLLPAQSTLDPIPGSPPYEDTSDVREPESPSSPTFSVTSEAAMRRKKMRRLTRKLGEGVPVDLVFPTSPDTDSDGEETPLLETPASDRRLPFSGQLSTIPESGRPKTSDGTDATSGQSPRGYGYTTLSSRPNSIRDAVYVVDSPDEHGAGGGLESLCIGAPPVTDKSKKKYSERSGKQKKSQGTICLGVSASAAQLGKGSSRRWVKGDVPLDQVIAGSWGSIW